MESVKVKKVRGRYLSKRRIRAILSNLGKTKDRKTLEVRELNEASDGANVLPSGSTVGNVGVIESSPGELGTGLDSSTEIRNEADIGEFHKASEEAEACPAVSTSGNGGVVGDASGLLHMPANPNASSLGGCGGIESSSGKLVVGGTGLNISQVTEMCSKENEDVRFRASTPISRSSFSFISAEHSEYVPSFLQIPKAYTSIPVPNEVCLVNSCDIDTLMQQVNAGMQCATAGCDGKLIPVKFQTKGLGGAVSFSYVCSGCELNLMSLDSVHTCFGMGQNELRLAAQIATLVSGGTYASYQKTFKHGLGIDVVSIRSFNETLKVVYPHLNSMLEEMMQEARNEMKKLPDNEIGSWSRAVLSADGCWMTCGFHYKNFTFAVRNYFNGALLYYVDLCQRGRDNVIEGELYQGTSKSMEGYAARLLYKQAKEDGLNLVVQWQDADSSLSNVIKEVFPNAKVMVCGGHAGRAHKKRLEAFAKIRKLSKKFIDEHSAQHPEILKKINQRAFALLNTVMVVGAFLRHSLRELILVFQTCFLSRTLRRNSILKSPLSPNMRATFTAGKST